MYYVKPFFKILDLHKIIFVIVFNLYFSSLIQAKVILQEKTFVVEQVMKGLSLPWGMVFLNQDQILMTERKGQIKLFNLQTQKLSLVSGVPQIHFSSQGGLMDIALPPDYSGPNSWIYFTYAKNQQGQGVTTLARAKLKGRQLVSWQDLLVTDSATNTGRHFGSRITFDGKGHLFFSVGDRGVRPNGQDLSTHAGSILRLNLDGSIPQNNPFLQKKNALPEIWSYGHRNPQGLFYDHHTKKLWSIEHGPRGGDEINFIQKGFNYGWATISYGKEYWGPLQVGEGTHQKGMEQPVKVYTPSIAPSSLIVYSGHAFPQWKGNLFSGALKLRHLNRIELNQESQPIHEERLLETLKERIRFVTESAEGWLYLLTDSGLMLRIKPI